MTSYQLQITVQHENARGAGADSWIPSQSALEREVIKICADQVPTGMGPACHLGVRSLNRCFEVATEQNRLKWLWKHFAGPLPGRKASVSLRVYVYIMCLYIVSLSLQHRWEQRDSPQHYRESSSYSNPHITGFRKPCLGNTQVPQFPKKFLSQVIFVI